MSEKVKGIISETIHSIPIEWETYSLRNGTALVLFRKNGLAFSWYQLQADDALAAITLSSEFSRLPWTQFRLGSSIEPQSTTPAIIRRDKNKGLDFTLIDPSQLALSPESPKHRLFERLEITDDPQSNTDLLKGQKIIAKAVLDDLVRQAIAEIDSSKTTETCSGVRLCNNDNIATYYVSVSPEMSLLTTIEGDIQAEDSQFRADPSNKIFDAATNKVILLKVGEPLIVEVDSGGKLTYFSQSYGKTPATASSGMEWKIGQQNQTITSLIKLSLGQVKNPTQVLSKIKRFLLHEISSRAEIYYPPGYEIPSEVVENESDLLTAITTPLKVDGVSNTLTDWLEHIFFEEETRRLIEEVYIQELNRAGVDQFVKDKLNYRVPEAWIFTNMKTRQQSSQGMMQLIASWESATIVAKRTAEIHRYLMLWYIAGHNGLPTDQYYKKIAGLAPRSVVTDDELNLLASELVSKLDQETFNKLVREVTPKTALQIQIEQELPALKGKDRIVEVQLKDIDNLTTQEDGELILELELCPLYENINGRTISEHARPIPIVSRSEAEIVTSMVGGKWEATKAAVAALAKTTQTAGLRLKIRAVFSDIGVVVSDRQYADEETVGNERSLYQKLLQNYCSGLGVSFEFYSFSDFMPGSNNSSVPPFLVIKEGRTISQPKTLEDFLEMLDLSQHIQLDSLSEVQRRDMYELLSDRLQRSANNLDLCRALVLSYTILLKQVMSGQLKSGLLLKPANLRLGMEIAESFIALTHLIPDFPQTTLPAINILVEKPK